MQAIDFFRSRIDAMINMNDPLAVLASRLPWSQIEAAVATKFEHKNRAGEILKAQDMFGSTETLVGGFLEFFRDKLVRDGGVSLVDVDKETRLIDDSRKKYSPSDLALKSLYM